MEGAFFKEFYKTDLVLQQTFCNVTCSKFRNVSRKNKVFRTFHKGCVIYFERVTFT